MPIAGDNLNRCYPQTGVNFSQRFSVVLHLCSLRLLCQIISSTAFLVVFCEFFSTYFSISSQGGRNLKRWMFFLVGLQSGLFWLISCGSINNVISCFQQVDIFQFACNCNCIVGLLCRQDTCSVWEVKCSHIFVWKILETSAVTL